MKDLFFLLFPFQGNHIRHFTEMIVVVVVAGVQHIASVLPDL